MNRSIPISSLGTVGPAAVVMAVLIPALAGQDFSKPVLYSVPGMDMADVRPDIVYKRDGGEELKMDIAIPAGLGADERRPAVIFIHGGPFPPGFLPKARDWGLFRSYGRLMAASGLVGVTFDHRYLSMKEKDLETSFSDVEEAVGFVRANAAAYHVDPERIAFWAFSGGGPHLSLALRGGTPYVRCLVSFYAILDLKELAARIGEAPEALEEYSPLARLSAPVDDLPPVLIARAGLDSSENNRSVDRFISRMFELNGDINLLDHPLGQHGFDAYDNDDQTRDIMAATIVFLKSRLNRPSPFDSKRARAAADLQALFFEGKIEAAREFVRTALGKPGDLNVTGVLVSEQRLISAGNGLLGSNPKAAVAAYEWAVELSPLSPNARLRLAAGFEAAGLAEKASAEARRAIALLDSASGLGDARKKAIREAAEALLKRIRS